MIIQVGHLNGEVRTYNLADQSTANELMNVLNSELACEVQLVQCGELVNASSILAGDRIYYVTVDAEGGKKKKKKKKNFAKPKKKKHRHRKVKLATLKLYNVDNKGVVQRSHKQCPQCPQGVYCLYFTMYQFFSIFNLYLYQKQLLFFKQVQKKQYYILRFNNTWLNISTDIIVVLVIKPLEWMRQQLKPTQKQSKNNKPQKLQLLLLLLLLVVLPIKELLEEKRARRSDIYLVYQQIMQLSPSNSTIYTEENNLIPSNPIGSHIQQPIDHSSPEMRLLCFAQSNDLEQFSNLLRSGPFDLSAIQNSKRFTALHYACFNNSYQMCEQIISHQERREKSLQNMENFINSTTNDGFTAVHFAAFRGNVQILTLLKLKGANLKATNKQGLNIMHIGAQGDQPSSIVFALVNGIQLIDLDLNGGSALHWACFYGQEHSVNYLLPLIEKKKPYYPLNSLDSHQLTPLHLAVQSGNTKLVKKLLIYGADKKIKGYGNKTPADLAQENDFKNIYNMLTKERGFLITYFNLKQGIKRVRKNGLELMRFGGFMIFLLLSYFLYMVDDFIPIISDYILFGLTLLFFIFIVCSNPGYQIRRQEPLYTLITVYDHQDVCPICNIVKLPRSKHCDICQRCVLVYDHHCPWINNCVGAENHLIFISFLISLDTSLIYALVNTVMQCFIGNENELEFFDEPFTFWTILTLNIFIEVIFVIGITALLVTQLQNIFLGQTTFERFAVQNQTSTIKSVMTNSNKNSLIEDELLSPKKDRFVQCSCKNLLNFLTNGVTQRKKEQAIKI